jgi:hypothetical protein
MSTVPASAWRKFDNFNKKNVDMSGPPTSQLVEQGLIVTPYPSLFSDKRFPLPQVRGDVLVVLVPLESNNGNDLFEVFKGLLLDRPTEQHVIRFCSQLTPLPKKDIHMRKTIVFPHAKSFTSGANPPLPSWLTLVWKPERKLSELCLFSNQEDRLTWTSPENKNSVFFAGIFDLHKFEY